MNGNAITQQEFPKVKCQIEETISTPIRRNMVVILALPSSAF